MYYPRVVLLLVDSINVSDYTCINLCLEHDDHTQSWPLCCL